MDLKPGQKVYHYKENIKTLILCKIITIEYIETFPPLYKIKLLNLVENSYFTLDSFDNLFESSEKFKDYLIKNVIILKPQIINFKESVKELFNKAKYKIGDLVYYIDFIQQNIVLKQMKISAVNIRLKYYYSDFGDYEEYDSCLIDNFNCIETQYPLNTATEIIQMHIEYLCILNDQNEFSAEENDLFKTAEEIINNIKIEKFIK